MQSQPKRKAPEAKVGDAQKKVRLTGEQKLQCPSANANGKGPAPTPKQRAEYEARKVQFKALIDSFHQLDSYGQRAFAQWLNIAHPEFWALQHEKKEGMPFCLASCANRCMPPPALKKKQARPGPTAADLKLEVFSKHLPQILEYVVGNRLDSMVLLLQASNVALTSRIFHNGVEVFLNNSVKTIDLRRDLSLGASLSDQQLAGLLSRTPGLNTLQLRYCSQLSSTGLVKILRARPCPKLRVLELGSASTKKSMDRRCSHRFSPDVARAIAGNVPALEVLNVNLMNCCDDDAIRSLTVNCPRLKELNIGAQSSNLTDDAFAKLLPINGESGSIKPGQLYHMQRLSLFGLRFLTDAGAGHIAKCLKGLRYLDLEACHNISNSSIGIIARECQSLESLLLGGLNVDDDAVVDLVQQRGNTLHTLDLSECTNLTDRSIAAVAQHCSTGLQCIDLSFVHGFTDKALHMLAKDCPNLSKVVILGCSFGFTATTALLQRCGARLREFTAGVSDDDGLGNTPSPGGGHSILSSIAAFCPGLRKLDFSGDVVSGESCCRVAKELRKVVVACHDLESLTLNSCDLSDADMHFIAANGARHLHTLMLYACNNLSPEAFSRQKVASARRGGSVGCSKNEVKPPQVAAFTTAGCPLGGFPELSYLKIADCDKLCGPGEVPTMKLVIRQCCRKKLWISFCGEGPKSEVAAFVQENKCEQFWIKTEKHISGPGRHIVNVEILPRCAQIKQLQGSSSACVPKSLCSC